ILLGNIQKIKGLIKEYAFDLSDVKIIDPREETKSPRFAEYVENLYKKRQRRGLSKFDATQLMTNRNYYAASMVEFGDADTLISVFVGDCAGTIRPPLQDVGVELVSRVAARHITVDEQGPLSFGDATVMEQPTEDRLARTTGQTGNAVPRWHDKARVA